MSCRMMTAGFSLIVVCVCGTLTSLCVWLDNKIQLLLSTELVSDMLAEPTPPEVELSTTEGPCLNKEHASANRVTSHSYPTIHSLIVCR
jgi:hypothetical protein